jgi:hypothetical protein
MLSPSHSPSMTFHCYICHCHSLCFILPFLSQVYTRNVIIASHVAKFINIFTKASMFLKNVFMKITLPLNITVTPSTAKC